MAGADAHDMTAYAGERNARECRGGLLFDEDPEILDQPLVTAAADEAWQRPEFRPSGNIEFL